MSPAARRYRQSRGRPRERETGPGSQSTWGSRPTARWRGDHSPLPTITFATSSRLAATSAIRASLFSRARAQTHSAPASVPLIHELEHIRNDVGKCFYQDGSENQRRENRLIRSEEQTSELQSLMRISYAVFCLK